MLRERVYSVCVRFPSLSQAHNRLNGAMSVSPAAREWFSADGYSDITAPILLLEPWRLRVLTNASSCRKRNVSNPVATFVIVIGRKRKRCSRYIYIYIWYFVFPLLFLSFSLSLTTSTFFYSFRLILRLSLSSSIISPKFSRKIERFDNVLLC